MHGLVDRMFSIQLAERETAVADNGQFLLATLMGTHDRLGEWSPFMLLAGQTDIIVKILSISHHMSYELTLAENKDDICEMEYFIGQNRESPPPQMFKEHCYLLQDNKYLIRYPYRVNYSYRYSNFHTAINRRYGETVWMHYNNVEILWFQVVDNDTLYTYNLERVLKCHDISKGPNAVWRFFITHGAPAKNMKADGNSVYFACQGNGKNNVMCVRDGKFAWRQFVNRKVVTELTVMDDKLYFATTSIIYIMGCKTGKQLYRFNMEVLNDHLHVESDNLAIITGLCEQTISCVDIKGGNVLWKNSSLSISDVKPTVFKDLVITVLNDRHLVALNKHTGAKVWTSKIGTKILNTPCVSDYYIYVGCLNKKVYKVNPKDGKIMWEFKTAGMIEDEIMHNNTNIVVLSRGTTYMYLLKK